VPRWIWSAALMLGSSAALATPRLPAAVRDDLSLSYTPACSLCHIRGNTGAGTQITPFALSARSFGFDGNQRDLATALVDMRAAHTDSDGDGVDDIDELIAGTDPNVYGPVPFSTQVDPSYGCSTGGVAGALALAGLLLFSLRRRRLV